MMMHEVGSDSNGEAAYDFVADAKKDTSGISTSNAAPSNAPHEASFALGQTFGPNSLVSPPPVVFLTTATAGPKPSYEFPPGSQDTRGAPPSLPRHPGISTFSPQFIPPQNPLSRFPGPAPVQGVADYLGALSGPKQGGGSFGGSGSVASVRPSGPSSTGPDLNEIFGSDVMGNLPPLPSSKPSLLMGLGTMGGPISSSMTGALNPGVVPLPMPRYTVPPPFSSTTAPLAPPRMGIFTGSSSVNPYSSQAAGTHLPSFSGLPPMPAHLQTSGGGISGSNPAPGMDLNSSLAANIPPPVQMMAVTASSLTSPGMPPIGGPPPLPPLPPLSFATQPHPDQSTSLYSSGGSVDGQSSTGHSSLDYSTPQIYSASQQYAPPPNYGAGGAAAGRSWFAQTSFETLKNVTEKAKNTVSHTMASIMTTLDPQMKQLSGSFTGSGTDNLGKEITVFYIGNETNNMMDAIKMGFEGLYKTCFVYTRSGTAAGHKTQTNFQNALNVASSTLTLARSAPQLQTSLLVAVEPFVVELTTDSWYVGSCVALGVPGGALLHVFTQLSPLPQGLITVAGESNLSMPLDELAATFMPTIGRDSWMEPLIGISWGATVALAARQLAANYKRRF